MRRLRTTKSIHGSDRIAQDLKFLAIGCTHAPITHEGYWAWVLRNVEEFKPDVFVHLGDALEAEMASRWPKHPTHDWTILREFEMFGEQVRQLNELLPGKRRVFLYGNHDSNLLHEPHRMSDDARALVSEKWNQLTMGPLQEWEFPTRCYAHDAAFRLGQLTFQHGGNTGKAQTLSHLFKQALAYGVPYGLHVSAHTHAPCQVSQIQWMDQPGRDFVANVGTGADWEQMHYMDRASKSLWGRGLVRGYVSETSVRHYKSAYAAPQWEAETLFHSWASPHKMTTTGLKERG